MVKFNFQQQTVLRIQKELAKMRNEDLEYEEDKAANLETNILELRELSTKLAEQLKTFELLKDKESTLKKQINEDNLCLTDDEIKIKQLYEQEKNLFSEVKTLEGIVKNIEEEIPSTIRTQEELSQEVQRVQNHYEKLRLALEQATATLNMSREALVSAQSDKENAVRNKKQAQKEMEKVWSVFTEARVNAGFTNEEQYIEAKMSEEMITKTEKGITDFQETTYK